MPPRMFVPRIRAIVCDVFGEPLELNRPDSTFMNHRSALYATDANLAQRIRKLFQLLISALSK